MIKRMITEIFGPIINPQVTENDDYYEREIERLSNDLATKRAAAIQYLGNKWILRGGEYNRSNKLLGQ